MCLPDLQSLQHYALKIGDYLGSAIDIGDHSAIMQTGCVHHRHERNIITGAAG